MLRYKTEIAWFSHYVRHPARKQSGSILTTPEPAPGLRYAQNLLLFTIHNQMHLQKLMYRKKHIKQISISLT